jgi:hypothetical protein
MLTVAASPRLDNNSPMHRGFVAATLALALIACNQRLPVAPTQSSGAANAPQLLQPPNIVRDDRGSPIAGATVSFWPPADTVTTNEAGRFPSPGGYVEMAFASKPGYESDRKYFDGPAVEMTLHDTIRVSVGQSARLTIGPFDAPGGGPPEPYRTRIVRVLSSSTVTAQIHVTDDANAPAEYLIQDNCGDFCPIRSGLSTFRLEGGTEYQLRIRTPNAGGDRTFTVAVLVEP